MKRTIIFLLAIGCSMLGRAQDSKLNQTVQVTNRYKTDLDSFEKDSLKTFIPDSLYKFDLNFDYSGFTNPYKAVRSEFLPSYTNLELAARPWNADKLYLKLGLGYTLNPEVDLEWNFYSGRRFKMGMFAQNRSYFGNYHCIESDASKLLVKDGNKSFGLASTSLFGFNGRSDWESCRLLFSLSYDGVHSLLPEHFNSAPSLARVLRSYNAMRAKIDFASVRDDRQNNFRYGFKLDYVLGSSVLKGFAATPAIIEHNLLFDAEFGYDFEKGHSLEVEALAASTFSLQNAAGVAPYHCTDVVLKPRYAYSHGNITVEAGLSVLFTAGKGVNRGDNILEVWPALRLDWKAVDGWLDVFVHSDMKGSFDGARGSAFRDVFNIPHTEAVMAETKDMTLDGGLRGNITDAFSYEIGVGYQGIENCPLYKVDFGDGAFVTPIMPVNIIYGALYNANAHLDFGFRMSGFRLDGRAEYFYWFGGVSHLYTPSSFKADVSLGYDLRSRVFPKIGCAFQSPYRSNSYRTQFIYDLYASVEGRLNNNLSLYLKGSNLLGRANQYIPLLAPKGVAVTAGVVLNF